MDKVFAALGLWICAMLALRMAVGEARRQRFDAACRRHWHAGVTRLKAMYRRAPVPDPARAAAAAQREAERVIERARQRRQDVDQEGNVIRPRAFGRSKKEPPQR